MCCGPKARPDQECTCDNGYEELLAEAVTCDKCGAQVTYRDLVFNRRFSQDLAEMFMPLGCVLCVPSVRVGKHGEAQAVPA